MKKRLISLCTALISVISLCACAPRKSSLPLQNEAEHFNIYANDEDTEYIEEMCEVFENAERDFKKNFNFEIEEKADIYIYHDMDAFKAAFPNGEGINVDESGLSFIFPNNVESAQFINMVSGYYVMALIYKMDIPEYMKAGFGIYANGRGNGVREKIVDALENNTFPTMREIKAINIRNENDMYPYACAMVDYIVNIYSVDRLKKFFENPNFKQTFDMSESEFYDKWLEYVKEIYPILDKRAETEHFTMNYTEADENVKDELLNILEENFVRITTDLHHVPEEKCMVYLYPTQAAINRAQGNSESLATGYVDGKNALNIVSPNDTKHALKSREQILQIAVHEYVHVVIGDMTQNLLPYLNEGIAAYEAGQKEYLTVTINFALKNHNGAKLPTMNELKSMSAYTNYEIYQYGYTIAEYIVTQFGNDKLSELVMENGDISVLGITEEEFYNGWVEFLDREYRT